MYAPLLLLRLVSPLDLEHQSIRHSTVARPTTMNTIAKQALIILRSRPKHSHVIRSRLASGSSIQQQRDVPSLHTWRLNNMCIKLQQKLPLPILLLQEKSRLALALSESARHAVIDRAPIDLDASDLGEEGPRRRAMVELNFHTLAGDCDLCVALAGAVDWPFLLEGHDPGIVVLLGDGGEIVLREGTGAGSAHGLLAWVRDGCARCAKDDEQGVVVFGTQGLWNVRDEVGLRGFVGSHRALEAWKDGGKLLGLGLHARIEPRQ